MRESSAAALLPILDDPLAGASDVAKLIEIDPAMTARILRLANSAFLGLPNPVVSAADAVTVVGFSVVRSVAVTAAAGLFDVNRRSLPPEFWEHALGVAAGAAVCSRWLGVGRGEAFSAGLLHDLGEALIYRFDPRRYRRVLEERDEGHERLEFEVVHYGMSHAEVAAMALDRWGLPSPLVSAVCDHHVQPLGEDLAPLTLTVALGERLVRAGEAASEAGVGSAAMDEMVRSAARCGIELADPAAVVERWAQELESLRGFIGPLR